MRNYAKPEAKVLVISTNDIILSSSGLDDMGAGGNLNTGGNSEAIIPGPIRPPVQ